MIKLCKDCRWFIAGMDRWPATCMNPDQPILDLVNGSLPKCEDARQKGFVNNCGTIGRMWEAKEEALRLPDISEGIIEVGRIIGRTNDGTDRQDAQKP